MCGVKVEYCGEIPVGKTMGPVGTGASVADAAVAAFLDFGAAGGGASTGAAAVDGGAAGGGAAAAGCCVVAAPVFNSAAHAL